MIKKKVDRYIQMLKQYKGAEHEALDRFNSIVQRSEDGDVKIILHQNLLEIHFLPDEDIYLDIYSDNTVGCSEDEYGKYMIFKDNVFEKAMEI